MLIRIFLLFIVVILLLPTLGCNTGSNLSPTGNLKQKSELVSDPVWNKYKKEIILFFNTPGKYAKAHFPPVVLQTIKTKEMIENMVAGTSCSYIYNSLSKCASTVVPVNADEAGGFVVACTMKIREVMATMKSDKPLKAHLKQWAASHVCVFHSKGCNNLLDCFKDKEARHYLTPWTKQSEPSSVATVQAKLRAIGNLTVAGKYDETEKRLNALVKSNPSATVHISRGLFFAGYRKNFEKAIREFGAAIRLEPNSGEAYYYRAKAKLELKKLKQSRSDFRMALKLKPSEGYEGKPHVSVLSNYFKVIAMMAPKAHEEFLKGIKMYEATNMLQGIKHFENAISIDSTYALAYAYKGACLHELNRQDEALKFYQIAINKDPYIHIGLIGVAVIYHSKGKTFKAIYYIKQLLNLLPDIGSGHALYAKILLKMGKRQDACQAFQRAIKLNDEDAVALHKKHCTTP
jgi:tetratricopeptide (TPR) repeat protein